MSTWTVRDIPDLRGRVAVVTGATRGLGMITARELARSGAEVTLAVRDVDQGAAVVSELVADGVPADRLSVAALDLASLASVRAFAQGYLDGHAKLDILVNNAGVMVVPPGRTADKFENQFGINHLGHFVLTGSLLPALLAAPAARVVMVTSTAASAGRINFGDLNSARRYRRWSAYAQSKLANLLFAEELDRRAAAVGHKLHGYAAHPGYAATDLASRQGGLGGWIGETAMRTFGQSAEMGALPSLYAATEPGVPPAALIGPTGLAGQRGNPGVVKLVRDPQDHNPVVARLLWQESERLTDFPFSVPPAVTK